MRGDRRSGSRAEECLGLGSRRRAAHHRRRVPRAGAVRCEWLCVPARHLRVRPGRQPSPAPSPSIPRHSTAPRRGGDDAQTGKMSTADDRNVDGEFVPPGQQFTGSVERVHTEARGDAGRRRCLRPLPGTTHAPGSRRARPSRITASPAWILTGEWSALVRALSEVRAGVKNRLTPSRRWWWWEVQRYADVASVRQGWLLPLSCRFEACQLESCRVRNPGYPESCKVLVL